MEFIIDTVDLEDKVERLVEEKLEEEKKEKKHLFLVFISSMQVWREVLHI